MRQAQLIRGDARALPLADGSVHCVVTSPPYWGLRAYEGGEGMIGLEGSWEAHLAALVSVFREVRRVLRDDGTLWLNYGDAYSAGGRGGGADGSKQKTNVGALLEPKRPPPRFGSKQLLMMPHRLAIALQDDGWVVRQDVVWAKPNPMPESVRDRPTRAHEYLFLLSKRRSYFYDADAVREPLTGGAHSRRKDGSMKHAKGQAVGERVFDKMTYEPSSANRRSVWKVATQPYAGAHFATFPEALVEPCIKAGTSERGVCASCLAPWRREVDVGEQPHDSNPQTKEVNRSKANRLNLRRKAVRDRGWGDSYTGYGMTVGWEATCDCGADVVPATVLDPFAGSGTTCAVAQKLGRRGIGVELAPSYLALACKRVAGAQAPLPLV